MLDMGTLSSFGNAFIGGVVAVTSLAFSPDSLSLASGSQAGTVTLWDLDVEQWKVRACEMAGRNLTQSEWEKYFPNRNMPSPAAFPRRRITRVYYLTRLDLKALQDLIYDPTAYGKQLTEYFFADPQVKSAFEQARASAQSLEASIRLRLLFGPSAPELNRLWWETLLDPKDGSPLYTDENLVFSRYLSSLDWRPVRLRPKGDLRALVVIANPTDLGENMAPIKATEELKRAQENLGTIPVTSLPHEKGEARATLINLIENLRETDKGGFDILYLVCHGALIKEEPWLWLENDEGKVARTSGSELVIRLKELTQRPRLIVLASCESAGKSAGEALSALGPRLAEAGIPAVIAMQGKVKVYSLCLRSCRFSSNSCRPMGRSTGPWLSPAESSARAPITGCQCSTCA